MSRAKSWEELVSRYGSPFGSAAQRLEFEQDWMTLWRASVLENVLCIGTTFPIRRIYCHRDMVPALDSAFTLLYRRKLLAEVKTFGGCWNVRPIRGYTDKWSVHCYGLAIDLNPEHNPLGGHVTWSASFIATMKEVGFAWGGDFKRVDGMHFQWAEGC